LWNVYFGPSFNKAWPQNNDLFLEDTRMRWEKPSFNDMRFGFEVTMYIYNR